MFRYFPPSKNQSVFQYNSLSIDNPVVLWCAVKPRNFVLCASIPTDRSNITTVFFFPPYYPSQPIQTINDYKGCLTFKYALEKLSV